MRSSCRHRTSGEPKRSTMAGSAGRQRSAFSMFHETIFIRRSRCAETAYSDDRLNPQLDLGPWRRSRVIDLRFVQLVVQAIEAIENACRLVARRLRQPIAVADVG